MASLLEIIIRGTDQITPTLAKVVDGADRAATRLGGIGTAATKFGGAISNAIVPLGVAAVAIDRFTDMALEDEQSVVRLQQSVIAAGLTWDKYGGTLEQTAKQGLKLGFADEKVRNSLSLLVAGTGSAEEAMKRLGIAQDVSRGTGIDLETTTRLLTKVTDESVNVFSRYGISLQEGMNAQEALTVVQGKFAGQAQAFADSNAGAMARTKLQMEELQESIGARLVPVLTKLVGVFNSMPPEVQTVTVAAIAFGAIFGPMIPVITAFIGVLYATVVALGITGGAAVLATGGLILLIPALIAIGVAAYTFRDQIMSVFTSVKDFIEQHAVLIAVAIGVAFPFVGVAILAFKFRDEIIGVFQAVYGFIAGIVGPMSSAITEPFNDARRVIGYLINRVNDLIDVINRIPSPGGIIGDIGGTIGGAFRQMGGPVAAMRAYTVGERGAELFVPRVAGTIIPNHALSAGGTSVNINLTYAPGFSNASVAEVEQFSAWVTDAVRRELRRG